MTRHPEFMLVRPGPLDGRRTGSAPLPGVRPTDPGVGDTWPPLDPLGEASHFLRMAGDSYCRSELTAG
jgi:hypothetical protein